MAGLDAARGEDDGTGVELARFGGTVRPKTGAMNALGLVFFVGGGPSSKEDATI